MIDFEKVPDRVPSMITLSKTETEQVARLIAAPYVHHRDNFLCFVNEIHRGFAITYQATIPDTGRLIGREGSNFRAMKSLLDIYGSERMGNVRLMPVSPPVESTGNAAGLLSPVEEVLTKLLPVLLPKLKESSAVRSNGTLRVRAVLNADAPAWAVTTLTSRLQEYLVAWSRMTGVTASILITQDAAT